jgi:hypothetical protein
MTKYPPPKPCVLLPTAPKGLTITPYDQWSRSDHQIWNDFDRLTEDVTLFEGGPYPHKTCIGRYQGNTVLFCRSFGDSPGAFDFQYRSGTRGNRFYRKLSVGTWVLQKTPSKHWPYDQPIFAIQDLLVGDGSYDVLSQIVPEEFERIVIHNMFCCPSSDDIDETHGENPLLAYIVQQVGSVDKIADPAVKSYVKYQLRFPSFVKMDEDELQKMISESGIESGIWIWEDDEPYVTNELMIESGLIEDKRRLSQLKKGSKLTKKETNSYLDWWWRGSVFKGNGDSDFITIRSYSIVEIAENPDEKYYALICKSDYKSTEANNQFAGVFDSIDKAKNWMKSLGRISES